MVVLSESGRLYGWGFNDKGELLQAASYQNSATELDLGGKMYGRYTSSSLHRFKPMHVCLIEYIQMNTHKGFVEFHCGLLMVYITHILEHYFTDTGTLVGLSQCPRSNTEGYRYMKYVNRLKTIT